MDGDVMQPGAVPGAVLELHAAKAALGLTPGINSPLTTQFFDISGNGNHGTLTNFAGTPWQGVGTAADPYRLVLDGSDDYVAGPDLGAAEDKTFTYEVWLATTWATAGRNIIGEDKSGLTSKWISLYTTSGNAYLYMSNYGASGGAYTYSTATINSGNPTHVVATCGDGNYMRMYVHGSPSGTPAAPASGTPDISRSTIGAYASGGDRIAYFPGSILAARIYPFALTPGQVAQNYNAGPLWAPAMNLPVIGSPIVKGIGGTP